MRPVITDNTGGKNRLCATPGYVRTDSMNRPASIELAQAHSLLERSNACAFQLYKYLRKGLVGPVRRREKGV